MNVRGLRSADKRERFARWLERRQPSVVVLQETHCGPGEARDWESWVAEAGYSSRWTQASANARGVAVLWRLSGVRHSLVEAGADGRWLHVRFSVLSGRPLHVVSVYAPTESADRGPWFSTLAEELKCLQPDGLPSGLWMIGGDWNFVEHPRDRLSSVCRNGPEPGTVEAQELFCDFDVEDPIGFENDHSGIVYSGRQMTFRSPHGAARLDRWYCSAGLGSQLRRLTVEANSVGDHDAVAVSLTNVFANSSGPHGSGRQFRLNRRLLKDPHFISSMRDQMQTFVSKYSVKLRPLQLWVGLKERGRRWARQAAILAVHRHASAQPGDDCRMWLERIRTWLEDATHLPAIETLLEWVSPDEAEAAEQCVVSWRTDPTRGWPALRSLLLGLESTAVAGLVDAEQYEVERMAIMARQETMQFPDVSLPAVAKRRDARSARAHVEGWRDAEGKLECDGARRMKIARSYFAQLFQGRGSDRESADSILRLMPPIAPVDTREEWMVAPSLAELTTALFAMPGGSAPGSDGLPCEYYRVFWGILGPVLHGLITDVWSGSGRFPAWFADGRITLIPKEGKPPELISSYRPITLLNVDYKIISKTVAARLMKAARTTLHQGQSNVPGRDIRDNVALVQGIIDVAEYKQEPGLLFMVDFEKAFDRVSHEYLWRLLDYVGVGSRMVALIQGLYRQARSCIVYEGERSTPFHLHCGLRQGDGLSVVLFNLVVDGLARLAAASPGLNGLTNLSTGPHEAIKSVHHADDACFTLALRRLQSGGTDATYTSSQITALLKCLRTYEEATGAVVNYGKSTCVPIGGASDEDVQVALSEQQCRTDQVDVSPSRATEQERWSCAQPGWITKYLGVPICARPATIARHVDEWVVRRQKLFGAWSAAGISLAGRVRIANSRIAGSLWYLASQVGLSDSQSRRLEALVFRFVWGGFRHNEPVARRVCYRPRKFGGLGLLNIRAMTSALSAKVALRYARAILLEKTGAHLPPWAQILRLQERIIQSLLCSDISLMFVDPSASTKLQRAGVSHWSVWRIFEGFRNCFPDVRPYCVPRGLGLGSWSPEALLNAPVFFNRWIRGTNGSCFSAGRAGAHLTLSRLAMPSTRHLLNRLGEAVCVLIGTARRSLVTASPKSMTVYVEEDDAEETIPVSVPHSESWCTPTAVAHSRGLDCPFITGSKVPKVRRIRACAGVVLDSGARLPTVVDKWSDTGLPCRPEFWRAVWSLATTVRVLPEAAEAHWRALHFSLEIGSRGGRHNAVCALCNTAQESHGHVFYECPVTQRVWTQLFSALFPSTSPGVPLSAAEAITGVPNDNRFTPATRPARRPRFNRACRIMVAVIWRLYLSLSRDADSSIAARLTLPSVVLWEEWKRKWMETAAVLLASCPVPESSTPSPAALRRVQSEWGVESSDGDVFEVSLHGRHWRGRWSHRPLSESSRHTDRRLIVHPEPGDRGFSVDCGTRPLWSMGDRTVEVSSPPSQLSDDWG